MTYLDCLNCGNVLKVDWFDADFRRWAEAQDYELKCECGARLGAVERPRTGYTVPVVVDARGEVPEAFWSFIESLDLSGL